MARIASSRPQPNARVRTASSSPHTNRKQPNAITASKNPTIHAPFSQHPNSSTVMRNGGGRQGDCGKPFIFSALARPRCSARLHRSRTMVPSSGRAGSRGRAAQTSARGTPKGILRDEVLRRLADRGVELRLDSEISVRSSSFVSRSIRGVTCSTAWLAAPLKFATSRDIHL